jgi:hypothetical protein
VLAHSLLRNIRPSDLNLFLTSNRNNSLLFSKKITTFVAYLNE